MLDQSTVVTILLGKTPTEVESIKKDAETVGLGMSTSISALNQSASFDQGAAAVILRAVVQVERIRRANPNATAADVPEPSLAHSLTRGDQMIWGP